MEENNTRKASDVLLDLEAKIDNLLNLVKSLDLNLKVLSNKINNISDRIGSGGVVSSKQSITIEAAGVKNAPPQFNNSFMPINARNLIPITGGETIAVENNPVGFLRTSRPETFVGSDPVVPAPPNNEAIVPSKEASIDIPKEKINKKGGTPVIQRVVDENGKSIFLADVEVLDSTGEQVHKTRTNGVGRWSASLTEGKYKVVIRKLESMTKERLESVQNIVIDGLSSSPFELKTLIIKG